MVGKWRCQPHIILVLTEYGILKRWIQRKGRSLAYHLFAPLLEYLSLDLLHMVVVVAAAAAAAELGKHIL